MHPDSTRQRPPLGQVLAGLEEWQRKKIKARLHSLGTTQWQWKSYLLSAEAHLVPAFVRDVIVEELPETAELFEHPKLKAEVA